MDTSGEFPRGKGPSTGGSKKIRFEDDEDGSEITASKKNEDLFKTKRSKKTTKTKGSLTPGEERFLANTKVKRDERDFELHQLTYETLTEGVLTLGKVINIRENDVLVSLPGRTVGAVDIRDVSDIYTARAEELLRETTVKSEMDIQPLSQMFKPEMIIVVKVKSVTTTKFGTHKVELTTNPKDLNSNWTVSLLNQGMIFTGAVRSREDHGYQIELGMNGVTAFLHKKQASEYIRHINDGRDLGVGQVLPVKISRPVRVHRLMATLNVEAIPSILRSTVTSNEMGLNYSMLLPGMLAEVIVMDVHKTGLKVHVFELEGLIHRDHLEENPEHYRVSEKINARILYILPNGTSPYLTLQTHMMPYVDKKERVPSIIEPGSLQEVRIERQEKRGMIVRFSSGEKGVVPIQRCVEEGITTEEEIAKKYRLNSSHTCRVLEYASLDKIFIGSFQKQMLVEDLLLKPDQVVPGTLIDCKIKSWNNGGAVVEISPFLLGFIYKTHFGDRVTNPQKKYPVNSVVKAKVITVDSSKKSIRLSAKKSIRRSTGVVLTSYEQASVGMTGHGIIRKIISGKGLQIETIGGSIGFMPISKTKLPKGITLEEKYKEDDVILFEVLEVNLGKRSIIFGSAPEVKPSVEDESLCTDVLQDGANNKRKSEDILNTCKYAKKRRVSASTENSTPSEDPASSEVPMLETPSSLSGEVKQKTRGKYKKKTVQDKIDNLSNKTFRKPHSELERGMLSNPKLNDVLWETTTSVALAADAFNDQPVVKGTKSEVPDDSGSENEEFYNAPETEAATKPSKKMRKKSKDAVSDVASEHASADVVKNEKIRSYKEYEELLADKDNLDNTCLWKQYIDSAISAGDVDTARAIAYRALANVNFSLEGPRLKLWQALLELEVKYGDLTTMRIAFDEALSRAEKTDIFAHVAYLYEKYNKIEEAKKTYKRWAKDCKDLESFKRAAAFNYKIGELKEGRLCCVRGVKNFPYHQDSQITLLVGQQKLEHKFGDPAKAVEILEKLVGTFPSRTFLWHVYLNALISHGKIKAASKLFRRIFEKMQTLPKLKTFIPAYNEFKKSHGDSEENAQFISQVVTTVVTAAMAKKGKTV